MAVEYLGMGLDDGLVMGRSTSEKLAFFNDTPIVQPTGVAAVTVAAVVASVGFGFSTSAQGNLLVAAVNTIIANLAALGLQSTP